MNGKKALSIDDVFDASDATLRTFVADLGLDLSNKPPRPELQKMAIKAIMDVEKFPGEVADAVATQSQGVIDLKKMTGAQITAMTPAETTILFEATAQTASVVQMKQILKVRNAALQKASDEDLKPVRIKMTAMALTERDRKSMEGGCNGAHFRIMLQPHFTDWSEVERRHLTGPLFDMRRTVTTQGEQAEPGKVGKLVKTVVREFGITIHPDDAHMFTPEWHRAFAAV